MIILPLFAFLSGIVTILSPCILPVLPIVLSGSVGGKSRPYGVILGFVASFSLFTLALSTLVRTLNIPPDALRIAAVVLIIIFGLVMVIPKLREGFEKIASKLTSRKNAGKPSKGFTGGLLVGVSLGLVWTPCVGPILASVISLAITSSVDGGSVFIILAYALGTSLPMMAIMLGGRKLISRFPKITQNSGRIHRIFGVLMIVVGVSIGFGLDRKFQTAVLRVFPNYGSGLTALENIDPVRKALDRRQLADDSGVMMTGAATPLFTEQPKNGRLGEYGAAPELVTDGEWLGSEKALTMADLKGKVVLLDFWTYSCVNCVRTIPHLQAWYEAYKDQGFIIIGVHSPEFAFERNPENVKKAMKDLGVNWPVVLDNDFAQWSAYNNRYWPAHYFIDIEGNVRYFHFGEGKYDTSEKVIRSLLREARLLDSGRAADKPAAEPESRTPETYLGYARSEGFLSAPETVHDRPREYTPAGRPENGQWNLDGTWTVTKEYIVPEESGTLELSFHAKDVFLVIEPKDKNGTIEVLVDGNPVQSTDDVTEGILRPDTSRLYRLAGFEEPGEHLLTLKINGEYRLFAFTFG